MQFCSWMVPTSAGLSGGSYRISSIATQLPDFMSPMHLPVILQISTRLIRGVMVSRSAQNSNALAVPIDREKLYRMNIAASEGQIGRASCRERVCQYV